MSTERSSPPAELAAASTGEARQPSVAYVILNWNQPKMTAQCLESLARQEYANFHVILVDNGSTDDSAEMLGRRFPQWTLISLAHNVGYSPGNNVGIRHALSQNADYILLLNNDTEVHPTMLSTLIAAAESDAAVGIAGPTMYYAEPPDRIWSAENRIRWTHGDLMRHRMDERVPPDELRHQPLSAVDHVDTCAALVRRTVFERIGLMDGSYFLNFDDLDLNVRAKRAGYKIMYVPQAMMWHKVSATMGFVSPATTYYMTRNALLFFWRNAPGHLRWLAVARILARTARTVAAWTLKPRYRTDVYRRKRDANLLAMRDFALLRYGRMGADVARVCYGKQQI